MRRPSLLSLTPVLAAALTLAACDRSAAEASAAAPAPPAGASAPVKWDYASKDPARNPIEANKEASVPGYNP